MSLPTVCLSIRQPWAWLILHAGKDVENRTWPTKFRGPVLIHAAKGMTRAEYNDAAEFYLSFGKSAVKMPSLESLDRGGIVGVVEIVDCTWKETSPWCVGPFTFVLRNARPLPFTPCRGALGFFTLPLGVIVKEAKP